MSQIEILFVDDEEQALKYFSKALGGKFPVNTASSPDAALEVMEARGNHIGVVVADQRMPGGSGVDLLRVIRMRYPRTVRILTTAYTELGVLVEAINTGSVYGFISKPWDLQQVETTLIGALEHYKRQTEKDLFIEDKIEELRKRILAERTFDIGVIAAKIGHYVNNALCPLTYLIDHMIEDASISSSREAGGHSVDFLKSIREHVSEVVDMIEELNRLSRPLNVRQCADIDLEETLSLALQKTENTQQQKAITFKCRIDQPLPRIRGSKEMIEKFFRFMIAEEVVSLPEKSEVRIAMSPASIDGHPRGVDIVFQDDISLEGTLRADNLFYPFSVRGSDPREFGIFLISCYFILNHHRGHVRVNHIDSGGLRFTFHLPCDPEGNGVAAPPDELIEKLERVRKPLQS